MAFKIVNGKLVRITDQADFGTAAQKAAGQKITGTLGVISQTPTPARRIEEVFNPPPPAPRPSAPITLGPGPVTPAPAPVNQISAGSNVQQAIQQRTSATAPPSPTASFSPLAQFFASIAPGANVPAVIGQAIGSVAPGATFAAPQQPAARVIPQSRIDEGAFLRQQRDAGTTGIPTGTLGLGIDREIASRLTLGSGERIGQAGEIVTGEDLRLQRYYATLNNPRTLGEFEALGSGPRLQAVLRAYMNGEEIHAAFLRFFWNQGLLELAEDGEPQLTPAGQVIAGDGGRESPIASRSPFVSGTPGRFASGGLGLTNWRIN